MIRIERISPFDYNAHGAGWHMAVRGTSFEIRETGRGYVRRSAYSEYDGITVYPDRVSETIKHRGLTVGRYEITHATSYGWVSVGFTRSTYSSYGISAFSTDEIADYDEWLVAVDTAKRELDRVFDELRGSRRKQTGVGDTAGPTVTPCDWFTPPRPPFEGLLVSETNLCDWFTPPPFEGQRVSYINPCDWLNCEQSTLDPE